MILYYYYLYKAFIQLKLHYFNIQALFGSIYVFTYLDPDPDTDFSPIPTDSYLDPDPGKKTHFSKAIILFKPKIGYFIEQFPLLDPDLYWKYRSGSTW